MKKLLVLTATNGTTTELFYNNNLSNQFQIDLCYFSDSFEKLKELLEKNNYDFIYIKDPFHSKYQFDDWEAKVEYILENSKNAYIIDTIKNRHDIYFEDKLVQYSALKDFMPRTYCLSQGPLDEFDRYIVKKKISSRAKDIHFCVSEVHKDHYDKYIIQEQLPGKKEYRVYVVFGDIIKKVAVKSIKTINSKVKIGNIEDISDCLYDYVNTLKDQLSFDIIGIDVMQTDQGYHVIEVNRSCAFRSFYNKSGINIAEIVLQKLLEKQ